MNVGASKGWVENYIANFGASANKNEFSLPHKNQEQFLEKRKLYFSSKLITDIFRLKIIGQQLNLTELPKHTR